jgi:GMP synthase (glutamine-hydrolysing)
VLGLQCHPEVRADRFEPWLIGNAGELDAAGIDINVLRAETAQHAPRMETQAGLMFHEWLDVLDQQFANAPAKQP